MLHAQKTEQSAQNDGEGPEHAVRAAGAFNRACQLTGLSSAELCRRLPPMIGKQNVLSRQTLADWRKGRQPVPFVASLAARDLADLRPPLIFRRLVRSPITHDGGSARHELAARRTPILSKGPSFR